MDRSKVLALWDESWTEGAWFGSWSKALEGIDAGRAAWKPAAGTHSIWQIVTHVCFWREYTLRALAGEKVDAAEVERRNFEEPAAGTEAAWAAARERLAASHHALRAVMADESKPVERPLHHLVHDANHLGQILYIRQMQGLTTVM